MDAAMQDAIVWATAIAVFVALIIARDPMEGLRLMALAFGVAFIILGLDALLSSRLP